MSDNPPTPINDEQANGDVATTHHELWGGITLTRHEDKAASRLAHKGYDGRFDRCVAVDGRGD